MSSASSVLLTGRVHEVLSQGAVDTDGIQDNPFNRFAL
jgi:hypothetical protein